jgi:hypothetical protein
MNIPQSALRPFGYTGIPTITPIRDAVYLIIEMLHDMTHDLKAPPNRWLRDTLQQYAVELGADKAGIIRTMSGIEFGFTIGTTFHNVPIFSYISNDVHMSPGVV